MEVTVVITSGGWNFAANLYVGMRLIRMIQKVRRGNGSKGFTDAGGRSLLMVGDLSFSVINGD